MQYYAFNEGWGQYDTQRIVQMGHDLDPTRLWGAASGWIDPQDPTADQLVKVYQHYTGYVSTRPCSLTSRFTLLYSSVHRSLKFEQTPAVKKMQCRSALLFMRLACSAVGANLAPLLLYFCCHQVIVCFFDQGIP